MTACFTGHRPDVLGGYDREAPKNQEVRAFLLSAIERLIEKGCKEFITGGALGVDQWAAELLVDRKDIDRHTIALPFKGYGENWPEESRLHLKSLCDKSHVHVVCDGPYAPYKNHVRNQWMVDNSAIVVAVWNSFPKGGTASCVRYAKTKGMEFIRYNPETKLEEPVYDHGAWA